MGHCGEIPGLVAGISWISWMSSIHQTHVIPSDKTLPNGIARFRAEEIYQVMWKPEKQALPSRQISLNPWRLLGLGQNWNHEKMAARDQWSTKSPDPWSVALGYLRCAAFTRSIVKHRIEWVVKRKFPRSAQHGITRNHSKGRDARDTRWQWFDACVHSICNGPLFKKKLHFDHWNRDIFSFGTDSIGKRLLLVFPRGNFVSCFVCLVTVCNNHLMARRRAFFASINRRGLRLPLNHTDGWTPK